MLSKPNRLSLRTDRLRLEKTGQTQNLRFFTVIVSTSSLGKEASSRFAILISKKLAPLSVTRHRLRRLVTEVLRHNLDKIPSGYDFLLIPKKTILLATPDQILSDLLSSLSRRSRGSSVYRDERGNLYK